MINTENNESVLDVVQKKEFIKNIYSKIVNLENEIELKDLFHSKISREIKDRSDYDHLVKLLDEEMDSITPIHKDVDGIDIKETKTPFFKQIAIKSNEMDDDSRDMFWSMIYTIIKLSDTMFNNDEVEAAELYHSWDGYTGDSYSFWKFLIKWISNQIKVLYPEVEVGKILSAFESNYNDTIDYLVNNIVRKSETELPFQDPCLVIVLSDLLDYVNFSVSLDDIELSGFSSWVFKPLYFNFGSIVAPSFCDLQDNGCDYYKDTDRKIFIGKFFQFVLQDVCLDGCKIGSENWKTLNKYKERFFSDKYLLEFLKSEVEKYSKEYLLEKF